MQCQKQPEEIFPKTKIKNDEEKKDHYSYFRIPSQIFQKEIKRQNNPGNSYKTN